MKRLIIVSLHSIDTYNDTGKIDDRVNTNYTYNDIIDLLIKAQKLRYKYPLADLGCHINKNILKSHPDIEKILGMVYDRIISADNPKNEIAKHSAYNYIEYLNRDEIGRRDVLFDNDYEYNVLKTNIGKILSSHFIFKEHDIEIQQRGGFDFNNKKIKFKKKYDPRLESICKLYNISCNLVKSYQFKYYHIAKNKRYQPYNVAQMFDDIYAYDYLEPIKRLVDYYSSKSYYSGLLERNAQYLKNARDNKIPLYLIDDMKENDRDTIALQYTKCRKTAHVITLWRPAIPALNNLIKILETDGIVYYVKTINISRNGIKNLLFSYYDDMGDVSILGFIENKLKYIETEDNDNPVCIILFDNVNHKPISGQASQYKRYLHDMILKYLNHDPKKYTEGDMIHVNDYFYQTIEYCQLILNANSIDVLNEQDCNNYTTDEFVQSKLKMQTLRRVLYSDTSLLELDRFIALNEVVFFAYGIRGFNDINSVLIDIIPNTSSHLVENIAKKFIHESTKFYFFDLGIQGTDYWKDTWDEKDKNILEILEIDNFKDLVLDPKYHFYFQGIKFVTLEFEIIRKLMRNRSHDHVDFLMMCILYKNIISKYMTCTNSNEPPFFRPNTKYKSIIGEYVNTHRKMKDKILRRLYTDAQIVRAHNDPIFDKYFYSEKKEK